LQLVNVFVNLNSDFSKYCSDLPTDQIWGKTFRVKSFTSAGL